MAVDTVWPTFPIPSLTPASPAPDPPAYKKGWEFDFVDGDFVQQTGGVVPEADGYRAWYLWCVKALLTLRNRWPIYSANYGSELDTMMTQPNNDIGRTFLMKTITETLKADPRTGVVSNFSFVQQGDQIYASFDVAPAVPAVGPAAKVSVALDGTLAT